MWVEIPQHSALGAEAVPEHDLSYDSEKGRPSRSDLRIGVLLLDLLALYAFCLLRDI